MTVDTRRRVMLLCGKCGTRIEYVFDRGTKSVKCGRCGAVLPVPPEKGE